MNLKLVSKNNMGVVLTLILVILLSQASFFNFLTDTHLGRMVLLAFIIFISYTSKFFGLLAVLFIIIAFNQNQYNNVYSYTFTYMEGFDGSGNTTLTAEDSKNAKKQSVDEMIKSATKNETTQTNKAKEGFCMSDRELNMLRGKQSNAIPVYNKAREQSDGVDPSDKSVFSSDYASF